MQLTSKPKQIYEYITTLNSVFREDLLFTNFKAYSTTKHDNFYSYSDLFRMQNYDDYYLDQSQCLASRRPMNFKRQLAMMKSTDKSKFEDWSFHKGSKLLDGESLEQIALMSFPFAGSNLLRKLIEQCTGIATGSTKLDTLKQVQGFKGEGITDSRVWIVSSNYPIAHPKERNFMCNKAIVLVRNPTDIITHFASYVNTLSSESFDVQNPNWWDWWVRTCAEKHQAFYETQLTVPVYYVKFEDLLFKLESTLKGILKFIYDVDTIEGTNIERRFYQVVQTPLDYTETPNQYCEKFSQNQADYIQETNRSFLFKFGYAEQQTNIVYDSVTQYYKYNDSLDTDDYCSFTQDNLQAIETVSSLDFITCGVQMSVGGGNRFVEPQFAIRVQEPGLEVAKQELGSIGSQTL